MVPTRDKNWFCQNTPTGKNNTTVLRKEIERETNQADKVLECFALISTFEEAQAKVKGSRQTCPQHSCMLTLIFEQQENVKKSGKYASKLSKGK